MKQTLLSLFMLLMAAGVFGQAKIAREEVLLEIGTGTWCQFCPGAAMGADDLVENGCSVAVIEYHNGDNYVNTAASARLSFYGISNFPTAIFDGVVTVSGGSNTQSMYSSYLPKYEQRIVVPSSVSISWNGYHEGNTYTVISTIQKHAGVSNDLRFHLSLTESGIQEAWQGQTELHFVERWMANNGQGETLDLSGPAPVTKTITFTIDPSWNLEELELVAFVQDYADDQVQQAIKVMLNELPPPPPVADFTADQTDFCEMGTVNFSNNSSFADTYAWSFPGGTPESSILENPTVNYVTPGIYDVSLTVTNANTSNTKTINGYIHVLTDPESPVQPSGSTQVCTTNMMDNYSIAPVPFASTYQWVLTPAEAGVVFGVGTNVNISWTGVYLGEATLKVNALNNCGESEFSPALEISIYQGPEQYTVNGGGALCEGEEGVEIGLSGSSAEVDYLLYKDGVATEIMLTGTGEPLSFGLISAAGGYTVKATDPSGFCTVTMTGSALVEVHPLPMVFDVEGEGTWCEGTSGAIISLQSSENQVKYELYRDGTATEITRIGDGNALNFDGITDEGLYTIMADNELCVQEMNGAVDVIQMALPSVPATPVGEPEVCINYTPTAEYATAGGNNSESYEWSLEPASAGTITGNGLTAEVAWDLSFDDDFAYVAVRGVNLCGQSTFSTSFEVYAHMCVGINTINDTKTHIYPNPVSDVLHVDINGFGPAQLTLSNSMGKIIRNQSLFLNGSHSEPLQVKTLEKGVYLLGIKGEQNHRMYKIIVK
ncbi:MAG: T9SS type A sorting domain-containing protein [Bacteroidia bacterium]|nr:Omp28-related outer membrane protein [Bacteroidales bacterium]MDD3961659.1 Omp28-related outer membrane protein [Bacteroidales bacterium]MDY0285746.1 Omp28-related outer membrane protein [Bacteroidales bacterium]NCD41085.1 T9SS type A sorting domain-containing protein [Bacteroidia bacterium]